LCVPALSLLRKPPVKPAHYSGLQAEVCAKHCLRTAWDAVVGTGISSGERHLLKCPSIFLYISFLICAFDSARN